MKGVIVLCIGQLVTEKAGKEKWEEVLVKSGLDKKTSFLSGQDVDDVLTMKIINSVSAVLNKSLVQIADIFGDYWINTYCQKIYSVYFRKSKSAKELLLNMGKVHKDITEITPNAHPPKFEFEWKNEKTLVMKYISSRGLIDFMIGLIKGVGIYYKESLRIVKLSQDKVEITFP